MKKIFPLIALLLPLTAFAHPSHTPHEHLSVALFIGAALIAVAAVFYIRHKK